MATPTHRLDWDDIVARIYSRDNGPERMRALWHACKEVLDNLTAYIPIECSTRPHLLEHIRLDDISAHVMRAEEEKNQVGRNIVKAFSTWRLHVTEVEAANAARLLMLASTVRTLADLHSKSTQPERVLARLGDLGRFIEAEWGVAIPLSGDVRAWAQKTTRRYDLLSADWREL